MAKDLRNSYRLLRRNVRKKFGKHLFKDLHQHLVHYMTAKMWSEDRHKDSVEICLVLTLAHDMLGIGFNRLTKEYTIPISQGNSSIVHNIRAIQKTGMQWATEKIQLGSHREWQRSANLDGVVKWLQDSGLFIDSVDIRSERVPHQSKKADNWSHKLNAPGQRYMVLQDRSGYIRKVWGGYSPKVPDYDFLKVEAQWFRDNCAGERILGDCHFGWGEKNIKECKFTVPKENPKNKKGTPENLKRKLTKKDEKRNGEIRNLRARVEHPFGKLVQGWECFNKPWAEDEAEMNYAFWIACAWHNSRC
eukprot:TRINITY_DN1310_c0_g1_i3.p1 TRINITY_DN1310_c0_g1~~TRINITY_DN1310_c0_g1_i3.p1  ORF type:complete len:304 (-),score=60.68 TRINITY_DN1310_c0_g1_i3:62-973(-)